MRFAFALATIAALTIGSASLAQANHRGSDDCTDIANATMTLRAWGEAMVKEKDGVRLYQNPDTGAWSLVSWDEKGDKACLLKSGAKGEEPSDF